MIIWRLYNNGTAKPDDTPFRGLAASAYMDFPADRISVQWNQSTNQIFRIIISDGTGNVNPQNAGLDFYEIQSNASHIRGAEQINLSSGQVLYSQFRA